MYESILVPTDGSAHAERAAHHAVSLAEAFDATLNVLSVADVDRAAGPFNAGGVSSEFVDRIEAECESAVEAVADLAGESVAVKTAVEVGDPPEAIHDYAEERDLDAIAMGTRGLRGLSRLVSGSVTQSVVRMTDRPVLTARVVEEDHVTHYDDVLLPTDGSGPAHAAVEHAIAVGHAYDATVHVRHIVDVGAVATGSDLQPPPDRLDYLRDAGEEATETIAEEVRDAGLDAEPSVEHGFPASGLLDYVDAESIDLVAMGTHGRTGLDRVLLGSTTERIIRRSSVPVFTVHPDEPDE